MKNQQEFNHDLFLTGKYRLVTRGGTEVPRESLTNYESISFPYCYLHENGKVYSITEKGRFNGTINKETEYDLFMLPIDETIPFDLDKFKSGEWDVVRKNGDKAIYAAEYSGDMVCTFHDSWCNYEAEKKDFNWLRLKPKPITPYTHPQLYEVSDDEKKWYDVIKYYDYVEPEPYPHKAKVENLMSGIAWKHLRPKQQPLEITKEMMIEKFGTDNYKMV